MTPWNGERNSAVTKGFPRRFRSFLIALMTTLPKSVVRGWVRRRYDYHPRRVAGRDCSRQAPSERHVQVSLHAAQALPTPDCGRGFTTVNP
jgi:hypothetical protein